MVDAFLGEALLNYVPYAFRRNEPWQGNGDLLGAKSTYLTDQVILDWEDENTSVAKFLRKLSSLGVDLVPHDDKAPTTDNPVIVLITNTEDTADLASRSRGYKEIIPVSFLNGPSAAFHNLSQVIVAKMGLIQAAERVARIVRFGGRTMVEWNRLVHEASEWTAKPSSGLLLPSERLPAALHLAQSDYAFASPQHWETVAHFLEAGLYAVAARRRRGRLIVGASSLALIVFIVLAVIQTVGALSAERRSVAEANKATASRLSGIAREYVELDPDIPSLLVDRAAELSDDPAVAEAVSNVAASTMEHHSIALPSVPRQVSAARDANIMAVSSFQDSSIMMLDGSTGQIIGKLDYGDGGPYRPVSIELSPDGAWLAVKEADRAPRLFATDEFPGGKPAHDGMRAGDDFLGWWQASQGIISRSHQLLAVDFISGEIDQLWSFSEGESVQAITLSADGNFIAIAMTERVVLLGTETLEEVRSFPLAGMTDVALSADGSTLFGARFPYGMAVAVGETSASDKITETSLAATSVEAIEAGFFAVGDRMGGLSLHAGTRTEAAFEVRAHLTDSVRLARLANGNLASIGFDKYLRLWDVPTSARLGTPTDLGYQPSNPSETAGGTHQIRDLGDGRYGVVIAPSYSRILVGSDHVAASQVGFAGLHTRSILSSDARYTTLISSDKLQVFAFNRVTSKWNLEPVMDVRAAITNMLPSGLDVGEVAMSADGRSVLVANATEARVWRAGENWPSFSASFSEASTPVAARLGSDGQAEVVTADGIIHQLNESVGELKLGDNLSPRTITSATFINDETLLYTDDAGALSEYREGTSHELLPPGSALSSFRIRASPDGRNVAVLASNQLLVVNRIDGKIAFEEASLGALKVVDVAFSSEEPERIETISSLGTIGTVCFDANSEIEMDLTAPREVTLTERTALSLNEVDPRG